MEANICLNCGHATEGNYCSECGQATSTGKITFKDTLNSFLSSTFSFEGPLLLTIHLLITNPGKIFREYLAGRRKAYYQPIPFFVLVTAIYLIVRSLINYNPLEGRQDAEQLIKIKEAARYMVDNYNNILFFLVFGIAGSMKLFYRKLYNLAEYTSVAFFITGTYILIGIILMLISKVSGYHINNYGVLILLFLISYSAWSFFQFRTFGAIIKYLLLSLLSILLFMILGFGLSMLMVSL